MSSKKRKFHLITPSESEFLEIIRDFIGKIATIAGFSDDYANKIQLSVDEACTNIIKHAYSGMKKKSIEIVVELNSSKIMVSVIDQGKGFKPSKVAVKDLETYLSEYRRGGLGLHLIKILMDDVQFSFDPAKRNVITMTKYVVGKGGSSRQDKTSMTVEKSK